MHLLAEESVEIECPLQQAYEYVCNLENFGQWFPGVITIVAEDSLDLTTVGKAYLETVLVPLRGESRVRIRVEEAQRNVLFITEGTLRPLLPRMEIRFQAMGTNSSRIEWKMYSRTQSALLRATLIPFARRVMRGRAKAGVAKLKRILEVR